jgi:hypothetical protein
MVTGAERLAKEDRCTTGALAVRLVGPEEGTRAPGSPVKKRWLREPVCRALQPVAQTECWMMRMTWWCSCSTLAPTGGRAVAGDGKLSGGHRSEQSGECAQRQK